MVRVFRLTNFAWRKIRFTENLTWQSINLSGVIHFVHLAMADPVVCSTKLLETPKLNSLIFTTIFFLLLRQLLPHYKFFSSRPISIGQKQSKQGRKIMENFKWAGPKKWEQGRKKILIEHSHLLGRHKRINW